MTTKQPDIQSFKRQDQNYEVTTDPLTATFSLSLWPVNEEALYHLEQAFKPLSIVGFSRRYFLSEQMVEYWIEITQKEDDFLFALNAALVEFPYHYSVVPQAQRNTLPRLLMFDMDSTLIQMECIDELARQCGFYDKVSAITESAMRGELDFSESLRARVQLLSDLPDQVLHDLAKQLPLTNGVRETIAWCQQLGIKTAVVSGGFTVFADQLKQELTLDYAEANVLEVLNGKLTGQVVGDIVDGQYKRRQLTQLTDKLNLKREHVWAVGDGANDIPMLQAAGVGVAFDAKPKVRKLASAAILTNDMNQLLKLLKHINNSV